MKKGAICRKVLLDKTKIGPYLIVRGKMSGCYHKVIQTTRIPKENRKDFDSYYPFGIAVRTSSIVELSVRKIQLHNDVFKKIKTGQQVQIEHIATKMWLKIHKESPELVQIRNYHYPDEVMIFTLSDTALMRRQYDKIVRLFLGNRIL